MKLLKIVLIITIVLLSSGCLEDIANRFKKVDVVYVNLSVVMEENNTVIKYTGVSKGELNKIDAPGFVAPEKFPGIFIKIKQSINTSNPDLLKDISVPNGISYNGTGNYSFTVQLYEDTLNESAPIFIYGEILDNKSMRLERSMIGVDLNK